MWYPCSIKNRVYKKNTHIGAHHYAPSSVLRPNLPPNPPRSRRKNLPIFFRFSLRLPAAVPSDVCTLLGWSMDPVGAGDDVPDGLVMPDPEAGGAAGPRGGRVGVPERATPPLAAGRVCGARLGG